MTICMPSASSTVLLLYITIYPNLTRIYPKINCLDFCPKAGRDFLFFPKFHQKTWFHTKNAIYGARIVILSILSLVYPNLIQIYSVLHGGTHSKSLDIIYNWFKSCGM